MATIRRQINAAGRERWVVDFYDQHGKRHQQFYRTRDAAEGKHAELVLAVRNKSYVDQATLPTFAEVAEAWLLDRQDRRRSTVRGWRRQLDLHLIPAFGDRRIDEIRAEHINIWKVQTWNRDAGRVRGKLGRTTVNQLLQTLRGVFRHAVHQDYLVRNPADRVEGLRKQRRKGVRGQAIEPSKVLTAEQIAQAIRHARVGLGQTYLATAFATGCRPGELQALRWGNVDLEAGRLHIEESLDFEPGARENGRKHAPYGSSTPVFGPTKSEYSDRQLDLPGELIRRLKEWKMSRRPEHKRDDSPVFGNSLGGPLHRAYLTKLLHEALDAARLPRISLHGCRHSFATSLISKGKQPNEVAALLGHANTRITLERYVHWYKGKPSRETMEDLAADIFTPASRL